MLSPFNHATLIIDSTSFLDRGPVEGIGTISFLVQVQALPRKTENHYQLNKVQLFIEND